MKKIGQVRKVIDVTTKDLDEILVGAFEGGSNYWLSKVRVKDKDYKVNHMLSQQESQIPLNRNLL